MVIAFLKEFFKSWFSKLFGFFSIIISIIDALVLLLFNIQIVDLIIILVCSIFSAISPFFLFYKYGYGTYFIIEEKGIISEQKRETLNLKQYTKPYLKGNEYIIINFRCKVGPKIDDFIIFIEKITDFIEIQMHYKTEELNYETLNDGTLKITPVGRIKEFSLPLKIRNTQHLAINQSTYPLKIKIEYNNKTKIYDEINLILLPD